MPATRPIAAQTPSTVEDEKAAGTQRSPARVESTPFTLRYDKLLIAVGAYSQS